jgi:hypothetical protein
MNRRNLLAALLCTGSLPTLFAQGRGRGKGKGNKAAPSPTDVHPPAHQGPYFRAADYSAVKRYYAGPADLPPGLRKKYARTGTLPPGWEKKIRPFPPELVRILPPPPPNYDRGYIDGVAVVYDRKTRVILDSIDLIAAIAGR